jgi:hypothetical protein
MDGVTETTSVDSAVSRGELLEPLFKVSFFTVITVATIGWVSAFGWIIVKLAEWMMA